MKVLLRHTKRIFRFIWLITGFIVVLLLGFHFWFIYHSEKTIEDLITWASDGKLKSSMRKFKIDYVNNNIDIKDLTIFNTDSSAQLTSYRFSTKDFHLRLRSRWELIFHKQLLIDSVVFNSPDIIVTRRGVKQHDTTNKKLLLAEELGNVYKTISQSLTVLNLQRFEITEGRVFIKDADNNSKPPFRLSHIFFSIDKLNIDSTSAKDSSQFIFSDKILLRITNQNILLPDNKSNVVFKELLIDSKQKLIRITAPGVNILPLPGQQSSFTASARSLNITGLDFNALYQQQLIKADSVFLENPAGSLEIYTNGKSKTVNNKKKTPIDSALLHLPVAININHIVLQHGDGVMHLHQPGKTTTFQTKNDNLSIVGVRINDSSGNTLSIDGFNYTIRNYIGYTPDSIYRIHFDSLQFINNKIVLYHFNATTFKKTKTALVRDYTIPRFEITGMDWFSFIFDNHFIARNAVLYDATLNIEKNNFSNDRDKPQNGNKKSIYQTLSVMDSILDLDQLQIVNGSFSYKQGNNLDMHLQHLNLNINADELTQAKSINQIVKSVKQLSFDTATVTNSATTLLVTKSNFNNAEKSLLLNDVLLNTDNGNTTAGFKSVAINDFSFDNDELEVNGIRWKEGTIHIAEHNKSTEKINLQNKTLSFLLNNIKGNNTSVFFENEKVSAEIFLRTISAIHLSKQADNPFQLEGLLVVGNDAKVKLADAKIQCSEFSIHDGQGSVLKNILFEQRTNKDTLLINSPSITFIPFLNKTIATGAITADSVRIHDPKIFFSSIIKAKEKTVDKKELHLPHFNINEFAIDDASLQVHIANKSNRANAECKSLSLGIKSVLTQKDNSLLVNHLLFHTNNFLFTKNDTIAVKTNADAVIELNTFLFHPATQDWQIQLDKFVTDSIQYSTEKPGNKQALLSINKINAENIIASNNDLKKSLPWLVNHSNVFITFGFVNWQSDNANLEVNGFQFSQNKKQISIHSFSIDPGKSRENFISKLVYREDYMQASSGQILIDGISMDDGILQVPYMNINNAVLNVYSDKLKKAGEESLQPLPVAALKKIPIALQINKIELNNMKIDYTELNEDTRHTGQVYFTHINGDIFNIASKQNSTADSLRVNVRAKFLDTMRLHLIMYESYTDALSGLSLQLQVGPGDLRLLNPFLAPLVSMQAKSGYLDTMSMSATGNEYLSHGNMSMYYHNLKADILDSGNVQHRKFGTKLKGFFANTLAIRNDNSKRRADFNFVRMRKKSSISYFLKMIVQGAAGSVAPISKILYRKEYKKEMKESSAQKQE